MHGQNCLSGKCVCKLILQNVCRQMIPILEALLKILPIQEQKYLWEIVSRLVKITSKRKNINFTCVSHTGQLHP